MQPQSGKLSKKVKRDYTLDSTSVFTHKTKPLVAKFYFLGLLLSGISVRVIGDIYLGECILALLAIERILTNKKISTPKIWRYLFFAGIIWTIANLIGSVYSAKSWSLILIAVFTPILTISCLSTCVFFMCQSDTLIFRSVLLFSIGRLIGIILDPLPYTATYPWKFGYGESFILLFIIISYYLRFVKFQLVGMIALCAISFVNQARTLAFMVIVSALALIPIQKRNRNQSILLILGICLPLIYWIYLNLGTNGGLGSEEISRARLLTATDFGPIAARKEIVFSAQAFVQSPIFGYGFDPVVNPKIIISGYQFWADHGYPINNYDSSVLPLHSFFWAALIQGGIFAGIFWFLCLVFGFKKIFRIMEFQRRDRVLLLYCAVAMVDRILFSPFGAYERLYVAIFVGTLVSVKRENPDR